MENETDEYEQICDNCVKLYIFAYFENIIISGSAAAKAGVHVGECIIKVNGVTVTSLDHLEVVKLISVAPYTTLTLSGGPSSSSAASSMGNDHYEKRDR
ncbi:hypothetical protein D917_10281, partial [Trichinella nativa]